MYSREIERLLNAGKIMEGDAVEVLLNGKSHAGILLPKISDVGENVITLKLDNGYNVGLKFAPGMQIKKTGSAGKLSQMPRLIVEKKDLPSIAIISTGGTIGTHIDYKTGGVFMSRTPEEILAMAPELQNFVNLKSLSSPFRTPSEDMTIENWKILAIEVAKQLNDPEIKGVVITHGTDTLHYTASALSFMLTDLGKPVALVGAQKSPDRGSFDGTLNLVCGSWFAAYSDCAEVAIVMHGSDSDDFCYAHRGTKARKMHSTRRDAFRSVNDSPLAKILADGKIEMLNGNFKKRKDGKTIADTEMENSVAILKIYPGSDPKLLEFLVSNGCRGVVLEATGLGHVPTGQGGTDSGVFDKKFNWLPEIQSASEKGVLIAITSQTIYGRVSPSVYRNLRLLFDAGAVFCEDMLTETAYVKLAFTLAHSKNIEEAKKILLENLAGEFNKRLVEKDILE
ncbi:Glu-tRNA(Gln) amidotransferase subunit GatD [Candidatus Micrarchaeota archaeon]|nr:Glu-tRNA(Gln) amidotransferase subunit GatD [Candidatus Micrarchaeota archaeon]